MAKIQKVEKQMPQDKNKKLTPMQGGGLSHRKQ